MFPNNHSDWAVAVIAGAFMLLLIYVIIHGKLQARKEQKEQIKKDNKV